MIDEAVGKILGMAMAYGVSVLGLFLAYVNYRKRIVKADKVMTGTAWMVVVVAVLMIVGGVLVVARLARTTPAEEPAGKLVERAAAVERQPAEAPVSEQVADEEERRWPWLGIVVPAAIFLGATLITTALHRHFSSQQRSP